MKTYLIAVADGSRACFFSMEAKGLDRGGKLPPFVMRAELDNPEHRLSDGELFSTTKSGMKHRRDGQANGNDDHREAHDAEVERRFARAIGAEFRKLDASLAPDELVILAAPRMLGYLRADAHFPHRPGLLVHERARDRVKRPTSEIQAELVAEGLLPSFGLPAASPEA